MITPKVRQALAVSLLLLILPLAVIPSTLAAPTVTVDKPVCTIGETVTATGTADPNSLVSIQLFDPDGVRRAIAQARADEKATYKAPDIYTFSTADPPGIWTVKAYQGGISATATFEVRGVDITPPTLSLSLLPRKELYKSEDINIVTSANEDLAKPTVKVTQTGAATKELTLTPVERDLRKWTGTYTITPGYDGPATIEVVTADLSGNGATASASIKVDTTPPKLTITAPTRTETPEIEVSGTVDDLTVGAVEVGIAGIALKTVNVADGRWAAKLILTSTGTNTIVAEATDTAGNVGTATVVTIYVGALEVIVDRVKAIEQGMSGLEKAVESGLAETRSTSEKGLAEARSTLEEEMKETRSTIKGEMADTRAAIEGEMGKTRAAIEGEMATLRQKLTEEVSSLWTWVLVAVILSLIAAVAATLSVITIVRKIVLK